MIKCISEIRGRNVIIARKYVV